MPLTPPKSHVRDRLERLRDAIAGGSLDLVDAEGATLVRFPISEEGGRIEGDSLIPDTGRTAAVVAKGVHHDTVLRSRDGTVLMTGLTPQAFSITYDISGPSDDPAKAAAWLERYMAAVRKGEDAAADFLNTDTGP